MGMYNNYRTDTDSEQKGVWLDYGDFRVRIARAGGSNKKFQKLYEERTRTFKRAIEAEALDDKISEQIMRELYTDAVVLGWEVRTQDGKVNPAGKWEPGIETEGGEIVPATRELMLATFENLPDLFRDIVNQSQKSVLFRAALREQAAGN